MKKGLTLARIENTDRIPAGIFYALFKVSNRAKKGFYLLVKKSTKVFQVSVRDVIGE
ncbi:hypothetical protein SpAn4DRAFT_4961 [Sporomusa ovata]|uniref:Uncharacterized protein n=1 Tax=Sporomusa ovata TaxID=2378 RepID=A0A0U1KXQ7_9FIRM|nr:hypothetical protein SpAn4DRAFT_4961 [Sporomusa ovata]